MKSSRRLAQFGLRTIFALIFLSALASLWLRAKLDTFAAEESAAERITRAGGRVRLEAARPDAFWSLFRPGGKHCQYVVEVELDDRQVSSEMIRVVASLRGLKRLWLALPAELSDDDIRPLSKLTTLKMVSIGGPSFGDSGLACLQNCSGLAILSLGAPRITDQGTQALRNFPGLCELSVSGTPITDAGFDPILQLKQLFSLDLPSTLSASSLRRLAVLPRLRFIETRLDAGDEDAFNELWRLRELMQLRLRGPGIVDRTIADISKSKSLARLEIEDAPNITDDCFRFLARAPALDRLFITRASVSRAGVLMLKRAPRLTGMMFHDTRITASDFQAIRAEMPSVMYEPSF